MKKIFLSLGIFIFIFVLAGAGCESLEQLANEQVEGEKIMIGGERDEHGCLGPAGYSWDEQANVCTRNWEVKNENQKKAAKIATEYLGWETGLTVVGLEEKDCDGCYVVHFTNLDNEQIEVELKNWEVYTGEEAKNELSCELASDCACGIHKETGVCFFGNKDFIDTEKECPDYCSGVSGNLELNCIDSTCKQMEIKEPTSEEKKETPQPSAGIYLSAKAVDNGVQFNWSITNVDVSKGFKIVKSTEMNPVYPGSAYVYLDNNNTRSYTWNIKDGKTYYFRVCQYLGGKCGVYSQNVKVTAPLKETNKETTKETTGNVSNISVKSTGGTGVAWTIVGTSPKGFKIVWSKNSNPTYPTRNGDKYIYLSDKNASATSLNAFDGSGTYYVRVCEYLGGKCGVYSNQITVKL